MKKNLASYFYYTRSERNGVLVLATVSLGFLLLPNLLLPIQKSSETIDFSTFERQLDNFSPFQTANTEGSSGSETNNGTIALFPFNPNDATKEDFIQLGLSPRVATTLIHYRDKGGRFFKK